MSSKSVFGIFEDDEHLLKAVSAVREKGYHIVDAISPFPVHGLDQAMGLKRTRISIVAFMFGITGTSLALLMMWYMNIFDWPMDIGGKPSFALYKNLPAFIPVTFESTVLCAAHGMFITFLFRCKVLPGVEPRIIDLRQSDDRMVLEVELHGKQDAAALSEILKSNGAVEVK
ncbi:MAG TPA: DUF3341 domain-containing protein [Bacteroidia bacterium]|nr:DUF3341 domain-containing protein [Bacteroidia bacterium]HNT79315.1 DUF3341 domain-containing protein [Bacteroidia bacterium]